MIPRSLGTKFAIIGPRTYQTLMENYWRLPLCVAALIMAGPARSQEAAEAGVFEPIIAVHNRQANVGLASVISNRAGARCELYLGDAVVEHAVPVGPETKFQVMSVAKSFLGAAVLKSMTRGLLDLDEPISTYLTDYPSPNGEKITVRMLLTHTSGLPHIGHPDRKDLYVQRFETATATLHTFQTLPLKASPGSAYSYASANYNLLAAILESVHGEDYASVLSKLVLDPLQLDETKIGDVQAVTPHLARSYTYVDVWNYSPLDELQQVPTWDFSFNPGGGNLTTTANNLAQFSMAFLQPGFFTKKELAMLYSPLTPALSTWSFGWFVRRDEDGDTRLSISGATPGVQAGIIVDPQAEVAIVALSNAWGRKSAGGDLVIGAPQRVLEAVANGSLSIEECSEGQD